MTIVDSIRLRALHSRRRSRHFILGGVGATVLVIALVPGWSLSLTEFASDVAAHASPDQDTQWAIVVVGVLLRLVPPLVGCYLVGVLFQAARYHSRMTDHLDAVADAICLAKADAHFLQDLLAVLEPKHIHFGKDPQISLKGLANLINPARGKL